MTLAYSRSKTAIGQVEVYPALITATASDATGTVTSSATTIIPNTDGKMNYVALQYVCSAAGGTSPTLTLSLEGSNDGTNWFAMKDSGGNTVTTSALSLAANATTSITTVEKPVTVFPAYVRAKYVLGGTSPTHNGVVSAVVKRAG